jgi:hypothetical protein
MNSKCSRCGKQIVVNAGHVEVLEGTREHQGTTLKIELSWSHARISPRRHGLRYSGAHGKSRI